MTTIGERIRQRRGELGLSQAALAALCKVSQSSIDQLESGKIQRPRFLLRLAAALACSPQWLESGDSTAAAPVAKLSAAVRPSAPAPEADLRQILSDGLSATADLPVYASAEGGAEGMVVEADAIEWVKRPEPLANIRRAFAVYVLGDSMSPAYEQGDLILVNPSHPPRRGDDVLLAGDIENGDMAALVKRLLSWNADAWKVRQFNPQKDFSLSRAAWPKAYVIVGKYRRR